MMIRTMTVTAVLAASLVAAEARPMTSTMTCAAVQRLVARSGAIVMNFTPTTYDRVVRDQRWCLPSEGTVNLYVPTRDNPQCFAGYTCREGEVWKRW